MKKTLHYPLLVRGGLTAAEPEVTITTMDVDHVRDRISPDGLAVEAYLRAGGPVLFAHDYRELPVAATTRLWREARGWRASFRWLEGDERAARVRNAWQQGVIGAASVGVIIEDAVRNELGGDDIRKATLVEWSLTAVPANPHATRVLKSLALWSHRTATPGRDPSPFVLDRSALVQLVREQVIHAVDAHLPAFEVHLQRALRHARGKVD